MQSLIVNHAVDKNNGLDRIASIISSPRVGLQGNKNNREVRILKFVHLVGKLS